MKCQAQIQAGDVSVQCKHNALGNSNFCQYHDKKSKEVVKAANFSHGLYTPYKKRFSDVGAKLLTRIDELREDPDLWSLRDDAAFITAIMDLRAESINEGLTLEFYRGIQANVNQLRKILKRGDYDTADELINALHESVNMGVEAFTGTTEIVKLIEKRTEIIEAEQRMMHAKAYTLEVDQAYSLVMQIFNVIKAHIKNADELNAIRVGIGKLLKTYQDADIVDAEIIDEGSNQYEINTETTEEIYQTD